MPSFIEIKNLTKYYNGNVGVKDVSLTIEPGQIFGIIGPNGSGKTTTLSILLDLIKPTEGTVRLFGSEDINSGKKKIGATLESTGFYPDLSGKRNLQITALIKDNPDPSAIDEVLQITGIFDRRNDAVKKYSYGMKQRLAIAGALLGDPALIIMDEPTNGLDPEGIIEIRELIQKLAGKGKTLLLASHLLSEMEKVCTHFGILRKGELIKTGTIEEVMKGHQTLEDAYLYYAKESTTDATR